MYIFNIGRGFCCFIRSPTNETLLIDCGCRDDFSPANYIYNHLLRNNERNAEYKISKLVITHPHEDHIEDIEKVHELLNPRLLQGRDYEWNNIKEPELDYEELDYYSKMKDEIYTKTVPHEDLGINLNHYYPSMNKAREIDSSNQAFLNNTSILSTIQYSGKKFLFTGDIQIEMWEVLLEDTKFLDFIENTKIFIAPHHGLDSAFSPELLRKIKPWISLISERSRENPNSGYSSEEYFSGITYKDERRRSFTTRRGTIYVEVREDGWWIENQDI